MFFVGDILERIGSQTNKEVSRGKEKWTSHFKDKKLVRKHIIQE